MLSSLQPSGSQKPRVIQRYLVISVSEQQNENERGRVETEKVRVIP